MKLGRSSMRALVFTNVPRKLHLQFPTYIIPNVLKNAEKASYAFLSFSSFSNDYI